MSYESLNFNTPSIFENSKSNSRILIIGGGHSTKGILEHKHKLREKFDVIIVCNYAFQFFDDVADFHIVTEKTSKTSSNTVYQALRSGNFSTKVTRIVNWKGLELYPTKYNLIKTTRSNFNYKCDIRKYKTKDGEGLLIGTVGKQNFSLGSVLLSAMHFSTILGSNDIYVIGADMCFKNEFDHFYDDRAYRDSIAKKGNMHKIIKVSIGESNYETTEFFKESAEYIDSIIPTLFNDIKIFDFSDGLLTKPIKLNINEFLK